MWGSRFGLCGVADLGCVGQQVWAVWGSWSNRYDATQQCVVNIMTYIHKHYTKLLYSLHARVSHLANNVPDLYLISDAVRGRYCTIRYS